MDSEIPELHCHLHIVFCIGHKFEAIISGEIFGTPTQQGRNQERANRAIAPPPEILQTWWHSRTSHEQLFLEIALPLSELLKTTFPHTCCIILDKTIKQSVYHVSENSQDRTGDKL